jgi:hypothetical protein
VKLWESKGEYPTLEKLKARQKKMKKIVEANEESYQSNGPCEVGSLCSQQ